MFHAHWGLRSSPFRGDLNPRCFFRSPTHEEALARLHYLTEQRRRLGLLLGGTGSGKSLVLQVFAQEIRRQGGQVAALSLLGTTSAEFFGLLAGSLGVLLPPNADSLSTWQALANRLAENRQMELPTVLLLDDADEVTNDVLDQVARLTQIDPSADARLTVVLAASPPRLYRLGRRLLGLVELRIELASWEPTETAEYLRAALRRAGRETPAFTESAVVRLHELAQGVPRRVNQLADLSLVAAAGKELSRVDAATVESVCDELGLQHGQTVG